MTSCQQLLTAKIATISIMSKLCNPSCERLTMARKTLSQNDIVKARGVGLKASEWAELEKIAKDSGSKVNTVAAYAIRYFLKDYRSGKIKMEAKKIQTLPEL